MVTDHVLLDERVTDASIESYVSIDTRPHIDVLSLVEQEYKPEGGASLLSDHDPVVASVALDAL